MRPPKIGQTEGLDANTVVLLGVLVVTGVLTIVLAVRGGDKALALLPAILLAAAAVIEASRR